MYEMKGSGGKIARWFQPFKQNPSPFDGDRRCHAVRLELSSSDPRVLDVLA